MLRPISKLQRLFGLLTPGPPGLADPKKSESIKVKEWLRFLPLADGTKAKTKAVFSCLYQHAILYGWAESNPIRAVKQRAKPQAGNRLQSTLGGAGLAISAMCQSKNEAAAYAEYLAQPLCQRTLYFESGGQPGHLEAWHNSEVNRRSTNFFQQTLSTLKDAYLRPRFANYAPLQEALGHLVHLFIKAETSAATTIQKMNQLCTDEKSEALD